MALFSGMYPSNDTSINNKYNIPIYTEDKYYNIINPNANVCPSLTNITHEMYASPEYIEHETNITQPLLALAETFIYQHNQGQYAI